MPVVFSTRELYAFTFVSTKAALASRITHSTPRAVTERPNSVMYLQTVTIARSGGFNRRQLTQLTNLVIQRRDEIERAWNEHFG